MNTELPKNASPKVWFSHLAASLIGLSAFLLATAFLGLVVWDLFKKNGSSESYLFMTIAVVVLLNGLPSTCVSVKNKILSWL